MTRYDDPIELAAVVAAAARPTLIGLDVDGVLAPIVAHASEARLLEGVSEALSALEDDEQIHIAVVSGRSIADLDRFGFSPGIALIGSHGMETRGHSMPRLSQQEVDRLAELSKLTTIAAAEAGKGAWVETKPASVVLHVREADAITGESAIQSLRVAATAIDGTAIKAGSAVLELLARPADKGSAITRYKAEVGAATTVFVGDDVTDEDAFAALGHSDITIKVGDAATVASYRLNDPHDVLRWIRQVHEVLHTG